MRMYSILVAAGAAWLLASAATFAAGPVQAPTCGAEPACGAVAGHCDDDCGHGCSLGCGHCCCLGRLFGHHKHGGGFEGLDAAFNCGCNGSYKFPVPPLYTYHWPGMYQHNLMTDYHSPWRFPPLKPYVDEVPAVEMGSSEMYDVQTASYTARVVGEIEPMSSRMLRSR